LWRNPKHGTKSHKSFMKFPPIFSRSLLLAATLAGASVAQAAPPSTEPLPLNEVKFWASQLQETQAPGGADALAASKYDMLVVEPARTEQEYSLFNTAAMVSQLKASTAHDGVHRKLVIAYVNAGEAENPRWYWKWSQDWKQGHSKPADWPSFILKPDPEGWGGNFPVAYWDPAWKQIVITGKNAAPDKWRDYVSVVDETIRDGFDGIYLDWVEGYDDPGIVAAAKQAKVDPAAEMVKFINEIRAYAQKRNPHFLIIVQNGAELIEDAPEIIEAVDALSQEHIWAKGGSDVEWDNPAGYDSPTDPEDTAATLKVLKLFRHHGKPVFNIEYAVTKAPGLYKLSRENGLVPYCSRSGLSQLSTTPPPEY
jgi:cysteinyl-tRNA synthetase